METDEMELDTIGDRKTALFVIISDTDDTFNFVVSILYTQLFNLLCDKADDKYGGRLPVHVRCLLDEFANIGQIPKFEKLIATIRSREISASIILQSQSQLKAIYKDNADTIVGNCDTTLFLGGKEKTTLKEISEILGKETIDSFNTSETRGRELSHGLNYQKLGKDHPYTLGCSVSTAPAVTKHIIHLHHRCHFQIHAEIVRKHSPVSGQLFNVSLGIFPYPLKAVIIQEKMHHPVKMILIFQICFVKADQQKVVKITIFRLEFWYYRNFPFPFPWELVTQESLTCTVIVVFLCHRNLRML